MVVLRELTSAGYGWVLITDADLGSGQTLHSHGLLNSGTGLVTGALLRELHELTLPYLRRVGVPFYGEDRSFLLAPGAVVDQLRPAWEANQYRPERIDPSSLPDRFEPLAPVYRVQGFNVDKRALVAALSTGLEPLVLLGEVVDASDTIRVQAKASGEIVSLEARAVVVAAGCGTKRLLGDVFAVDEAILDRIKYTKAHMICLRGPAGVLPYVGTVVAPELMIVGHPSPGHPSPSQGLVTWYVTPASPVPPPRHEEAPDNGAAAVDAPVVTSGVEALGRLVPSLFLDDERIQATVFAGYKQDFDGEPTRRVCEVVDAERNVLMVLPSVLANAVPNAFDALTLIRARLEGTVAPADVPRGPGVAVGELNEDADPMRWTSWGDFAHMYEGRFE
ncbi:MAG TPA: FAD-dependent oxidoreductase [Acidimicrobiales bacterium]|nr:FAD-dependent oxidoreductase [Acidimicrobiales bacterium]